MDLNDLSRIWPGLLFALGCFAITYLIRRVVEGVWTLAKSNHYWAEIVLPTMPILVGGIAGMVISQYPYPIPNASLGFRLMMGVTAGFMSSWAVRILKAVVKSRTGVDLDVESTSTPVLEQKKP